ncbi:hypothetical protein C8R47DRAFT_1218541 [Mycena vitilis]|nr:hypothetical protein C8R47DRAFT_1218541 [Mycena vitilis]
MTNSDKVASLLPPPTIALLHADYSSPRQASPPPCPRRRRSWLRAMGPPPLLEPPLPLVGWGTGGGWGGGGWGSDNSLDVHSLPSAWGSDIHSNGGWGENSSWSSSSDNAVQPSANSASLDHPTGTDDTGTDDTDGAHPTALTDGEAVEPGWNLLRAGIVDGEPIERPSAESAPGPLHRDIRSWDELGANPPPGIQEAWTRFFSQPPAPPPHAKQGTSWDHPAWDNPAWDDYARWMSAPVSFRMLSSSSDT